MGRDEETNDDDDDDGDDDEDDDDDDDDDDTGVGAFVSLEFVRAGEPLAAVDPVACERSLPHVASGGGGVFEGCLGG